MHSKGKGFLDVIQVWAFELPDTTIVAVDTEMRTLPAHCENRPMHALSLRQKKGPEFLPGPQ